MLEFRHRRPRTDGRMARDRKPELPKGIREALSAIASGKPLFARKEALGAPPSDALLAIDSVRARTLAAAMQILADKGVAALSLRAIADSAGIGLASIYHYFANKDELLLQLALTGFHDLQREIAHFRTLPEHAPPMRAAARAFFNFVLAHPALATLMFDEHLMAQHGALREAELATIAAYRASMEEDDRLPPEHQENAAHAIWAMGRGIAALIASYPPGEIPPDRVEKLLAGAAFLIDRGA
ncbi:MAG: hypothetical protein C0454_03510 [Parvibaculum sp.]|nr:hypothetical protein [Parvibaculum sp.]